MTVCLDRGPVFLDGDKTTLNGVLRLDDGSTKRFRIVDSTFGRVRVDPVLFQNSIDENPQLWWASAAPPPWPQ